jgi:GNAT superfamily N-acetyltransferase
MKNRHKKSIFKIRPVLDSDRKWVRKFISKNWGADKIVSRRKIYYPHKLPGFVAVSNKRYLGLITYHVEKSSCQLITLNSVVKNKGIGTALLKKVRNLGKKLGWKRMWGITTNDNLDALKFYWRKGCIIKRIHPNAISYSRKLKPEIPLIGNYGIPIRDEIEIEFKLKK